MVGHLRHEFPVFIDDNTTDSTIADQRTNTPYFPGNQRRQAFSGLVQYQYFRIRHQRAAYCQHLLLTTTELLPTMPETLLKPGEGFQHALVGPVTLPVNAWPR